MNVVSSNKNIDERTCALCSAFSWKKSLSKRHHVGSLVHAVSYISRKKFLKILGDFAVELTQKAACLIQVPGDMEAFKSEMYQT